MENRRIVFALLLTLMWTGGTRAGDLNVVGNLFVASNLTANLLTANQVTLSGETRTNWPGNDTGSAVELSAAVLDLAQPGQLFRYTLKSDTVWVFTNHVAGRQIWLQVMQDSTGGWKNIWPTKLLWPVGSAHNGSISQNCFSVFKIMDNGTAWLGQAEGLSYQLPCSTNCQWALQFDGHQNFVSLGSLFGSAPAAITIEMWVKGNAPTTTSGYLFSMSDVPGFSGALAVDSVGRLLGGVATDAGSHLQTVAGNLMDGNWHHVALVWDGAKQRLYVDGDKKATTNLGGTLKINNAYIGARAGANPFTGTIDEVRLSKVARYVAAFTPDCVLAADANTVGLWHFGEGDGTMVADSSGNGHTGTLQGALVPTWVDGMTCGK